MAGIDFLADPFALSVFGELAHGRVPPTPLVDRFLLEGGDFDQCCKHPGMDVVKFRYFFNRVS